MLRKTVYSETRTGLSRAARGAGLGVSVDIALREFAMALREGVHSLRVIIGGTTPRQALAKNGVRGPPPNGSFPLPERAFTTIINIEEPSRDEEAFCRMFDVTQALSCWPRCRLAGLLCH